jgi:hypothetical protein
MGNDRNHFDKKSQKRWRKNDAPKKCYKKEIILARTINEIL